MNTQFSHTDSQLRIYRRLIRHFAHYKRLNGWLLILQYLVLCCTAVSFSGTQPERPWMWLAVLFFAIQGTFACVTFYLYSYNDYMLNKTNELMHKDLVIFNEMYDLVTAL